MTHYTSMFRINGDKAIILARDTEVQRIIDHFKSWIPIATDAYGKILQREKAKAVNEETRRLQAEADELRRREHLRRTIKL